VAAIVAGVSNHLAESARNRRIDSGVRRQIRAAALALATYVLLARQFGGTNPTGLRSSLAYLEELVKDRSVDTALSDKSSRLIHEVVDLCNVFIGFSETMRIDPQESLRDISPRDREQKMALYANAVKPTFDKMREYFIEDGLSDAVAEFDAAEAARVRHSC
jgi:hypothetical protein